MSLRLSLLGLVLGGVCCAAEPAITWRESSRTDAPEAVQAAAADSEHLYAVTNDRVARYDRRTGKRNGMSTGAAKHLNSGWLEEGKLYCAHSNYPQTPELSELKVLDLQSLELSTYHDFGDFGGSLTWAVRHDGSWWCNFARYGEDNKQTFLARFDDDWKEQGRWTYPGELIRELGRYSLSGGVWREGSLLVTGHDDPLLFELKLPREGRVLEWTGTHQIPFTGQGIAEDPLTGGLIGIDRGKKQIVLARPPERRSK